jgi:hypothetical protein
MLIKCFFIFQGYVLNDFSNQYNIVANVTKLHNFTQCFWMFEGELMLTLKLFVNTQVLWKEHYNRITRFSPSTTYMTRSQVTG